MLVPCSLPGPPVVQKLRLRGDALLLRAMSGRELLVTGRIRTAEWE